MVIYLNQNNLTKKIILMRLLPLDINAQVTVRIFEHTGLGGAEIETTRTTTEVYNILSTPPTQAEIDAETVQTQAESVVITGYQTLPAFVKTMTAAEAEAHINAQIFNGQNKAQLDASIDAAIVNITTANVAQINAQLGAIRTMLKAAVGALIGIRDLFIFTSKLLLYIRDLVIRFRQ